MKYFAGLDVSMKTTFICIVNENGKVICNEETKTDPILIADKLKHTGLTLEKVGIESGALSFWLVNNLQKLSLPALCIDARKMASILSVQINKTDKNDAKGIADAMRCDLFKEVVRKSDKTIELSILMGSRRTLVNQRTQLKNTIRGFLKSYGIRLSITGENEFITQVRENLSKEKRIISQESLHSLISCYKQHCIEITNLEKVIESLAKKDEDIKRFMTIPGVGIITAMTFKIVIGDPYRFSNSRDIGAYIGMTPRQYSSGEIFRQGAISKCGSTELRFLLTEAGIVVLTRTKKWSKLKAWGLKIMRKHGMKKAGLAVGRKLAIIMHRMMLDKKDFIYGENKK